MNAKCLDKLNAYLNSTGGAKISKSFEKRIHNLQAKIMNVTNYLENTTG